MSDWGYSHDEALEWRDKRIAELEAENRRLESRLVKAAELRTPANDLIAMQKQVIAKLEAEVERLKAAISA